MKLDNRPKKILVKDVGEEHSQTLRDWFEVSFVTFCFATPDADVECTDNWPARGC